MGLSRSLIVTPAILCLLMSRLCLAGQVSFDGTLPGTTAGSLSALGNTFTITPSQGYLAGANLFHSFLAFNIDSGETALFTNGGNAGLLNVIARVTGGSPTTINGTVRSEVPNFWFVNPSGLTIGKGAVIDVPGVLALGTADFVQFRSGDRWYAGANGGTAVNLIVSNPASFGFLDGSTTGALSITDALLGYVQSCFFGAFCTPQILLAGRNVTVDSATSSGGGIAGLQVRGGTISLENLAAPNQMYQQLDVQGTQVLLDNVNYADGEIEQVGGTDIRLAGSTVTGSAVVVSASNSLSIDNSTLGAFATQNNPWVALGRLVIHGGTVSMTSSNVQVGAGGFRASPAVLSFTADSGIVIDHSTISGEGPVPADIAIEADGAVVIRNNSVLTTSVPAAPAGPPTGIGFVPTGGALTISASGITVADSRIASVAQIIGDDLPSMGGNISLNSQGSITITRSVIDSSSQGAGSAGNVTLSAPHGLLSISDTSRVTSEYLPPNPGDATAYATSAVPTAGDIELDAQRMQISNGSTLSTSTAFAQAGAGNITVRASSDLVIDHAVIESTTTDIGGAGEIFIQGGSVTIHGGRLSTATTGPGTAGNVVVEATGPGTQGAAGTSESSSALIVDQGAQISSDALQGSTSQVGNVLQRSAAGTVTLQADAGTVEVDGVLGDAQLGTSVSTAAGTNAGAAGSINIRGVNIDMNGALVETSVGSGASLEDSPAAAISLDSSGAIALNGSSLVAATTGNARAGAIGITGLSIDMIGGTVAASTEGGSGSAGTVSLIATGADTISQPALRLSGPAEVQSTATNTISNPTANAGSITARAANGTLQVVGNSSGTPSISTSADARSGAAGDINLSGRILQLQNAEIATTVATTQMSQQGPTTAAQIKLDGTNEVSVTSSKLSADTSGSIGGGDIIVGGSPVSVVISDSTLSTTTTGTARAGDISISDGTVSAPGSASFLRGAGVTSQPIVSGATVTLSNSTLSSDAVQAAGVNANAGAITLNSSGDINLQNSSLSSSVGLSGGRGGNVTISGSNLVVGRTIAGTDISTSTAGTGSAGEIALTARGVLQLNGGSIISSSTSTDDGAGPAGQIQLTSTGYESVNSTIAAKISGGTLATSPANITISSGFSPVFSLVGGQITTDASQAQGGNITVDAGNSPITMQSTSIAASAGAHGNGGNIALDQVGLMILKNSQILATAYQGNGGHIDINLVGDAVLIRDSTSRISADSDLGNNGTVAISAPDTGLSAAIHVQNVEVRATPELRAADCAPRTAVIRSTFVLEGQGGIAPDPGSYLVLSPDSESGSGESASIEENRSARASSGKRTHTDDSAAPLYVARPCG